MDGNWPLHHISSLICGFVCSISNTWAGYDAQSDVPIPNAMLDSHQQCSYTQRGKSNISNWSPIALHNTITKLYPYVLMSLEHWAFRNKRTGAAQTGLMLANLCNEHNFILQSINTDM
jgi:hypothetical protein